MIQVYCHKETIRLHYVLEFIFEDQYQVVLDKTKLSKEHKVLNYSNEEVKANLWMIPSGLLQQESLIDDYHHGYKHDDALSNIFYVLTRYEEYVSEKTDHFERFPANVSEQFKSEHLDEPIVDEWVYQIREKLGIDGSFPYQFIPTFDIDNAWAYKNKGSMRTTASKAKDMVNQNKVRLKERAQVLSGKLKDPYDTFEQIEALAEFQPKVFFLLGDYAKYDRNINWKNKEFQELIRKVDQYAQVGIHPSFDSFGNPEKVKKEKERLEEIVGHEIIRSRQHFLRLKLPDTYQILESIGIKEDYSMGFAAHYGWRAGTSRSFYFFDLLENRKTDLKIFPFQYMDGTLNEYLELNPEKAKEAIEDLTDKTKKFGGNFICLWHNETIGNYGKWDGWKEVLNYNISLNEK